MNNKDIYRIDREYRSGLKKICINALSFFHGLPLEWQDIYNGFLMEIPKILENYKNYDGGNFKGYLFSQCKYFSRNYCRSFITNGHRIMNRSVSDDAFRKIALQDSVVLKEPIDTSIFTDVEMVVYTKHFLDEKSIEIVSKETHISFYKVRNLAKSIKTKLLNQFKN